MCAVDPFVGDGKQEPLQTKARAEQITCEGSGDDLVRQSRSVVVLRRATKKSAHTRFESRQLHWPDDGPRAKSGGGLVINIYFWFGFANSVAKRTDSRSKSSALTRISP